MDEVRSSTMSVFNFDRPITTQPSYAMVKSMSEYLKQQIIKKTVDCIIAVMASFLLILLFCGGVIK